MNLTVIVVTITYDVCCIFLTSLCESVFNDNCTFHFQVLGSHNKAVNAVAFDWEQGQALASVGDDYRFVLWNVEEREKCCEFPLNSAGLDVKFYKYDGTKVSTL